MTTVRPDTDENGLDVVSLFSGIGGLDLGLTRAGHRIREMCESWTPARRVLASHFHDVPISEDVATFHPESGFDVLTAGFPCTDLSHAGSKTGIFGEASGLVRHAFTIAEETRPEWIVLENVPNLLLLHQGAGIAHVVSELERLQYRWAYRTVDTRFTGLPQRRFRVLIVASRSHHPQDALFEQEMTEPPPPAAPTASGFYWTEGRQGVGLVHGAVPTLKGGSTLGLPSTPAVWFPDADVGGRFVTLSVEDGEALQGFERGWTKHALSAGEPDLRWKLLGNAVPVDVGHWVGTRLTPTGRRALPQTEELRPGHRWPRAAWGHDGRVWTAQIGTWPIAGDPRPLQTIVEPAAATPLSYRATSGFLSRLDETQRERDAFYLDLEQHQQAMLPSLAGPVRRNHETALLQALTQAGLRVERQTRPIPSVSARYPIVVEDAKVAVELRRCFWFRCPEHPTSKTLNEKRWASKIDKNISRSDAHRETLKEHGWDVHTVWEHDDAAEQVRLLVNGCHQRCGQDPDVSSRGVTVAV